MKKMLISLLLINSAISFAFPYYVSFNKKTKGVKFLYYFKKGEGVEFYGEKRGRYLGLEIGSFKDKFYLSLDGGIKVYSSNFDVYFKSGILYNNKKTYVKAGANIEAYLTYNVLTGFEAGYMFNPNDKFLYEEIYIKIPY